MSIFKWLFRRPKSNSGIREFRDAIGIDVSGPDFFDLYPTKQDFVRRLEAAALFRHGDVEWIATLIHREISASAGERAAIDVVIRSGQQLDEAALSALGLYRKMKIGRRFVASLSANDVGGAIERFRFAVRATVSRANQLHNLRRSAEVGVVEWRFSSARDERSTPLERQLEGKVMSLDEARAVVVERGDEITRSTFMGIVKF